MPENLANYETLLELRIWLKIGLAQENKGSYDAAAQAYQEAIQITEAFLDQAEAEATAGKIGEINFHLENINHLKLLFQPHLCQAYLLEKSAANVHTSFNLILAFLARLRKLLNSGAAVPANFPLFCAECLIKTGDLFYYKGFPPYKGFLSDSAERKHVSDFDLQFIRQAEDLYFEAIGLLLQTYFYGEQVEFSGQRYLNLFEKLTEIFCFSGIQPTGTRATPPSVPVFQLLANVVSDLSNIRLTQTEGEEKLVRISSLMAFLTIWRRLQHADRNAYREMALIWILPGPWAALGMNLLAARIFLWASLHKEAAFEYEKMIQTLRYCNIDFPRAAYQAVVDCLELLQKELFTPGQQHYFRAYLNVPDNSSLAGDSESESKTPGLSRSPILPSAPPEAENLVLYWLRLQDRFIKKSKQKVVRQEVKIPNAVEDISDMDIFDNIKIRIDRLNFKVNKLNDWYQEQFKDIPDAEFQKQLKIKVENEEFRNQLFLNIKDGLFCCYNSIILREIHSNTYWWLHLGRAFMHYFLAQWLQRWQDYFNATGKPTAEERELMNYIGTHNLQINQQLQLALENFHQVKETHTNGRAYKTMIKHLYFLNNDFNDRAYHFHLAHERAQLWRGKVEKKMQEVEALLRDEPAKKPMAKFNPPAADQQLNLPF